MKSEIRENARQAILEAYGRKFMKKYAPECLDYIEARVRNNPGDEGNRERYNTASALRNFYCIETGRK